MAERKKKSGKRLAPVDQSRLRAVVQRLGSTKAEEISGLSKSTLYSAVRGGRVWSTTRETIKAFIEQEEVPTAELTPQPTIVETQEPIDLMWFTRDLTQRVSSASDDQLETLETFVNHWKSLLGLEKRVRSWSKNRGTA